MYIIWGIFILIIIFLILRALFKYNISFQNLQVLWIFAFIILFCLYVLGGLHITENLESLAQITLTWIVYTVLWITFLNVFMLGYFWSVVRNKVGPSGLRGPIGERGKIGLEGTCDISLTQEYCMKAINTYIDSLYKAKTNTNILNAETQKFPCRYLNNKISVMAGSRQYTVIVANLSSDNKPIINVINYLKSLWIVWFELIYDATETPGMWFTDEYADEEYGWIGNNPFDEIKKYDVYYWGVTRDFRPLKAELCRSTSTYDSAKIPRKNTKLVPRLKIIQSNDYYRIGISKSEWTVFNHTDNIHTSWWSPKPMTIGGEDYNPVGDVMALRDEYYNLTKKGNTIAADLQYNNNNNGPDLKTILISGDVTDPLRYDYMESTGSIDDIKYYKPICPDGYKSLGDILISRYGVINKFKCVPSECVEDVAPGPKREEASGNNQFNYVNNWFGYKGGSWLPFWHDTWYSNMNNLNNWDSGVVDAKPENGYNLARAGGSEPFRKIKDSCLAVPPAPKPETKDVEAEYADLGIGWNGNPYKQDPKYSIFTFLNLVPEGIIVNTATGRRFYIRFYGGEQPNIYNVLDYNDDTGNYDNALQVSSEKNDPAVVSRTILKKDVRQQWIIVLQGDKKYLTLKSMFSNRYLYIGLNEKYGNIVFLTMDLDNLKTIMSNLDSKIDTSVNSKIINESKKLIQSIPNLNKADLKILEQISITKTNQNITNLCNLLKDSINKSCMFTFISSFSTQMDIIDKQKPENT